MKNLQKTRYLVLATILLLCLASFTPNRLIKVNPTDISHQKNKLRPNDIAFSDDFESGLSQWVSITGLWHLTDTSSAWPYPCHSPIHSMWFGQETTGNYDTGFREYGEMVSIPFSLVDFDIASVEFYHWREGEGGGIDVSFVDISTDGVNWYNIFITSYDYIAPWEHIILDISEYVGNPAVQLRFRFDTVDEYFNSYRGWLVDDIQVLATIVDHDLIVSLETPSTLEIGNTYMINATVFNNGNYAETNVDLYLYLDDGIVDSTTISSLTVGASETINYMWTVSDYGRYKFTAYAPLVPDEAIIENNIATKILYIFSNVVFFDEAHLPIYSIGSNPAYSEEGGYSEFAGMLTTAGCIVNTIDPGTVIDATVLSGCDILVIEASQNAYAGAELDAIETWVEDGGSLLLISDHTNYGTNMDLLAARFGFDFANDILDDSDDGLGTGIPSQLFYDGPNILSHPITMGVSRVEMYAGDGLIAVPIDEIPLIKTDTDGTTTWWSDETPALGVSVMSAVDGGSAGEGKVCIIGDCNIWDNAIDTDEDGELNFYDSDNEFLAMNTIYWLTLPDSITVTSPTSSSSWETGTIHPITWTSEGSISYVKIELFKNGVFEMEIVASTPDDGSYDWTIPMTLVNSTQYQIKISDVSNSDTNDFSDEFEMFTTPEIDSLTITSPDNSCSWETNTSQEITWTSTGSISNVKIELFKDGVFEQEIMASTANDGTYSWDIPTDLEDGTDYQIKISDVANPTTSDFSEEFEIFTPLEPPPPEASLTITSPDSTSVWEMGTSQEITWTSTGSITNVKIELFKDGAFEQEIMDSTANVGTYNWSIPTDLEDGTDYQIKISDVANSATYDESSNFTITSVEIPGGIPSYNLYIVIGIIGIIVTLIFKKRVKLIK
ncbi:MAG: Ser-Thr-rich GPI-anchored membrane family protein [Promethearchaeota archaeon]